MVDLGQVSKNLIARLRQAERRVFVDYSLRRFKHVIKRAEELGAGRLLILGDSELERGVCKVRSLGAGKEEVDVALDEVR